MSAPVLLSDEPLDVYHGDPLTIELKLSGDVTAHSYRSQVRRRDADDEVLAEFTVGTEYDSENDKTSIVLLLLGDSDAGVQDSPTRLITTRAVMDVQEYDDADKPVRTLCRANLRGIRDVTR